MSYREIVPFSFGVNTNIGQKYLPSAAATRKRLLDRSRELEVELAASKILTSTEKTENKKWSQIYSYSYNESLTGCVEQLVELERYTKAVVGELG